MIGATLGRLACCGALVASIAACSKGDAGNAPGSGRPGRPGGARAVPVETVTADLGVIAQSLTVSGVVEPIRSVSVNSQISGTLLAVEVEEGRQVRTGQTLARLDDRELRTELAAAEAEFEVAQAAFERSQGLRERQVITLPEFERDRTAQVAAQARLDQARTRISYATIDAPISGVITEKRVESGDLVAPQSRLFTIADLSTKVVLLQVSELDVVHLAIDDRVSVALDAFPDREVEGHIRRIFPSADPATRLVPVEVALAGASAGEVRPGFLARVTFALGERENVLLVPASALVGGGRSPAVFVVEGDHARRRDITAGLSSRGQVEILGGLAPGDTVITVGNNSLQDGATVRVIDQKSGASAGGTTSES
ncbi:MAG: efflux RND transporter periplasmic adaptor subunit [Candidatus Eisenbacteria bacterium]